MKTLFDGTSKYYAKYRAPYPQEMFEDVVAKFGLNGQGRLLDVGSGPGVLAVPLSKYFKEVVAVEVDPGMAEAGRERAHQFGVENIQWLNKSGDELNEEVGKFKLVTLGSSFHWLDRERFAKLASKILDEDGGIFITWTGQSIWNKERSVWEEKVLEVIKKYLGSERRAGDGLFKIEPEKHEEILRRAGFERLGYKKYPSAVQVVTAEDIINGQYTTSYATRRLFGDRATAYEKELTAELLKINPANVFEEQHVAGSIFAWKS